MKHKYDVKVGMWELRVVHSSRGLWQAQVKTSEGWMWVMYPRGEIAYQSSKKAMLAYVRYAYTGIER